jgi:hypothetical protein
MYCKKCGKFIGNDSDLCDECRAKEEVFSEFGGSTTEDTAKTYYNADAYTYTKEVSLGMPIAATILSHIGFFMVYLGVISVTMFILGLVPSILGLIFGVRSIGYFKSTSAIRSGKRIPVLILGIVSVVMSGLALFIATLVLLIAGFIA